MSESMSVPMIFTIGVYGFDEVNFFKTLQDAQIDTFCDVRYRRGVRGAEYAFANSQRLQAKLTELNILYIHRRDLAPDKKLRSRQTISDKTTHVAKRQRTALSPDFIDGYEELYLSTLNSHLFVEDLGPQAQRVILFCVEREPEACHRSLLANRLSQTIGAEVIHLTP
jgi:uncharacterized protein (DUF488 family)